MAQTELQVLGKAYWGSFYHMMLNKYWGVYKLPKGKLTEFLCSGSILRFRKRGRVPGYHFLWKSKAASAEAGKHGCCDLVYVQLLHFKFTALCYYYGCYKRICSKNNVTQSDVTTLRAREGSPFCTTFYWGHRKQLEHMQILQCSVLYAQVRVVQNQQKLNRKLDLFLHCRAEHLNVETKNHVCKTKIAVSLPLPMTYLLVTLCLKNYS